MIKFGSALDFGQSVDKISPAKVGKPREKRQRIASAKPKKGRGCEFCPLNKVHGLHKVMNLEKVVGKKIMIWAQNPGELENIKRMELVGPAGKLLWAEAAKVGLKREDCGLQNVVRCWTVDVNELDQLIPREPSKEEIHCCSIYTEEAIKINQ